MHVPIESFMPGCELHGNRVDHWCLHRCKVEVDVAVHKEPWGYSETLMPDKAPICRFLVSHPLPAPIPNLSRCHCACVLTFDPTTIKLHCALQDEQEHTPTMEDL